MASLDEVNGFSPILIPYETENILAWWKANQARFPVHYRLAIDFLSIHASTTAVERANSESGRESTNSFVESMCIRSWRRDGGLKPPTSRKEFVK